MANASSLAPQAPGAIATGGADLAASMLLRGAVGALAGAAASPKGREGAWAAGGFVSGLLLGQVGIVGVLTLALWKKAG